MRTPKYETPPEFHEGIVPHPPLDDLILNTPVKGLYCPTGIRQLAYDGKEQRHLLMHAIAHLPVALATCSSLRQLRTKATLSDDSMSTSWSLVRNGMVEPCDPMLPPKTQLSLKITRSEPDETLRLSLMWIEGTDLRRDTCLSLAIGFENEGQLIEYVKVSRSAAIDEWLMERKGLITRDLDIPRRRARLLDNRLARL